MEVIMASKLTFEKFCREYIPTHPELKLETDEMTPSEFAKVAKEHGQQLGFTFSDAEIQAVLGEHRAVRRQVAELGGEVKGSANGTAMCWHRALRTDEPLDADWLVITATPAKPPAA
jgi:hypothetical protein